MKTRKHRTLAQPKNEKLRVKLLFFELSLENPSKRGIIILIVVLIFLFTFFKWVH
jgi:hypothetical protein